MTSSTRFGAKKGSDRKIFENPLNRVAEVRKGSIRKISTSREPKTIFPANLSIDFRDDKCCFSELRHDIKTCRKQIFD